MTTFVHATEQAIEVWENGVQIAVIYAKANGVKIISKYLDGRRGDLVFVDATFPPALHVAIWRGDPDEYLENSAGFFEWLERTAPETIAAWRETWERELRASEPKP